MKRVNIALICTASFIGGLALPSIFSLLPGVELATAYGAEKAGQKTKRVPALREKVYSQLARAQKLADDGDSAAGLQVLDTIKERASSMNDYEVAMMYNFYGFIYYNDNKLPEAIEAFKQVVATDTIPESLRLSTTFSLAQLAMANEDYRAVIGYLDKWEKLNTKPVAATYYVLKSQAYYQMKDYQKALASINTAINLSESNGEVAKENWLILQRALYYSMNKPEQVTAVLEKLVKHYSKAEYWVQLAGMYGETGKEKEQLAILEAAKQQGFIEGKNAVRNLAQVYLFNGLAFKAADLMQSGIKNGVLEDSAKNNAFIAEAYVQAREDEKSVPYFIAAAKQSKDGQYDLRLAEVYINLEQYGDAGNAAMTALEKGGLAFESNAYVALGMAQYNLQNFDASILAFEQAEKHKKSQHLAEQWLKYVKREKLQAEALKTALM